ncbi:MAG: glycosyltransferase family 39 protein [Burkholderiaceae bacterium]|nr:glycosyltransferase family 39 protein [Burkholderiaceae bacterium]
MNTLFLPAELQSTRRSEWLTLAVLVGAIVVLHLTQLRPGHDWGDDYAMYLSHALNLLSGKPYADTGFLPNPWAVPGPPTYPPVYPLMITPVVAVWGLDLQPLKVFGIAMLGASLAMSYALWRPRLGVKPALCLVALLGLSPFFVGFRNEVRPDTLFMFLFLATLWLGDRWAGHAHPWSARTLWRGLALGVVAYLAYGTRSLGLVLLPALWLVDLWRLRRPTPVVIAATLVCAVLVILQSAWLHTDAGYAGNLTLDAHTLRYNLLHYVTSLSVLWTNALPSPWDFGLRAALFVSTLVLASVGYIASLRRGIGVLEVVPWLYFVPLVIYWVGTMIQQRYLLPLFPLFLYYAWVGGEVIRRLLSPRVGTTALALLVAAIAVAYGSGHAAASRTEIRPGTGDAESREVYAWLRDRTPVDAVILVGRARAIALNTQRVSVSPFGFRTDEALWGLIAEHRVTHVVVGLGPLAKEMDYEHPDDLARFAAANVTQLQPVFRNAAFEIHAVTAPPSGLAGR